MKLEPMVVGQYYMVEPKEDFTSEGTEGNIYNFVKGHPYIIHYKDLRLADIVIAETKLTVPMTWVHQHFEIYMYTKKGGRK